jgi:hypothetical protein
MKGPVFKPRSIFTANSFSVNQVLDNAEYLEARWPILGPEAKRRIVECITNKIEIGKKEISIGLCCLHSTKELSKKKWSLGGSNP